MAHAPPPAAPAPPPAAAPDGAGNDAGNAFLAVLPIVLAHMPLPQPPPARLPYFDPEEHSAALLGASRATRQAVHAALAGRLRGVVCQCTVMPSLLAWLRANGVLFGELEVMADEGTEHFAAQATEASEATAQPQQQQQQFQRLFRLCELMAAVPLGVQALSVKHFPHSAAAAVAERITQLTALRELRLITWDAYLPEQVLQAAAVAAGVTRLHLESVTAPMLAARAPRATRDLTCRVHRGLPQQPPQPQQLRLARLTACTALQLLETNVRAGDELPPGLVRLSASDALSLAPLLQLRGLQSVQLLASTSPAGELSCLRQLPALSAVKLCYSGPFEAEAAAAAWPELQLVKLSVRGVPGHALSAAAIGQLGRCTALTELSLWGCFSPGGATARQLSVQLHPGLARLRRVNLPAYSALQGEGGAAAQDAGGPLALAEALARLPQLESLSLRHLAIGDDGAAALGCCTRLTWLQLDQCSVSPAGAQRLKAALPRVRRLRTICGIDYLVFE